MNVYPYIASSYRSALWASIKCFSSSWTHEVWAVGLEAPHGSAGNQIGFRLSIINGCDEFSRHLTGWTYKYADFAKTILVHAPLTHAMGRRLNGLSTRILVYIRQSTLCKQQESCLQNPWRRIWGGFRSFFITRQSQKCRRWTEALYLYCPRNIEQDSGYAAGLSLSPDGALGPAQQGEGSWVEPWAP